LKSPSPKLIDWVQSVLPPENLQIEQLRKEASSRDYFRVKTESNTFVVMNSEDDIDCATKFLYVNKLLKSANVNCPSVYGFSDNLSYILMEDLGDEVLDGCKINDLNVFFTKILDELKKIYLLPQETLSKISYNELLSQTESFLNIFKFLDKEIDEKQRRKIQALRKVLVEELSSQPQVPSHSDFERRNMIKKGNTIYLIDFQDLHVGPVGIDLASLFYDHENYYDEKTIQSSIDKFSEQNEIIERDKIYNYVYIALAHRCMRIVGTFIKYFNEGKLLNRRNDLEKFIKRLVFALDMLNMSKEKDIIENII
tara:strand:- start:1004 stop:1936 length:933 start_codon:yes stop_codon:yes gene_type:complete